MDKSSTASSSGNPGSKRPWLSLMVVVLLWSLALELILWFVPIQPRAVIRIPHNDDLDPEISENLAGFSPDGKMLITTVERITRLTGQIHLWDATTGEDLGVVGKEGTKLLPNLVYCPQRNLLSETSFSDFFDAADRSRTCILYDLIVGQEKTPVRIDFGESCLWISPDGRTLAYCTNTQDKRDLKLIDVQTGQVRVHLEGRKDGDFAVLTFSQDGRVLATTETNPNPDVNNQNLILLDTGTGEWRRILLDHGEELLHLVISPDGTKLAAECLLGNTKLGDIENSEVRCEVRLWDLRNGKQIASFEADGLPDFVEDGKGLALCHRQGITFYDSKTGKEYAVAEKSPFMAFVGYAIPSSHLFAVHTDYESKPGPFFQWCATYFGIKGLGEQRNGEELAFLDIRTGKSVAAIIRPKIFDLKIFPDGTKLALRTSKNDHSIIEIWDIPPRKPLRWILGLLTIPSVVTLITLARWSACRSGSSQ